jgi:DNA-binding protein H-NS
MKEPKRLTVAQFKRKYPGMEIFELEGRRVAVWAGQGEMPEWMCRELGTKGEREGTTAR